MSYDASDKVKKSTPATILILVYLQMIRKYVVNSLDRCFGRHTIHCLAGGETQQALLQTGGAHMQAGS